MSSLILAIVFKRMKRFKDKEEFSDQLAPKPCTKKPQSLCFTKTYHLRNPSVLIWKLPVVRKPLQPLLSQGLMVLTVKKLQWEFELQIATTETFSIFACQIVSSFLNAFFPPSADILIRSSLQLAHGQDKQSKITERLTARQSIQAFDPSLTILSTGLWTPKNSDYTTAKCRKHRTLYFC